LPKAHKWSPQARNFRQHCPINKLKCSAAAAAAAAAAAVLV
jgi:hypothetical protein